VANAALPLSGLRVIDTATLAAGPLVATALGEFGAEVIKVEEPRSGDPLRTWGARRDGVGLVWKSVGRNKKCVTLDLRRAGRCCTSFSTSVTCWWPTRGQAR
jgi:crotonobetainyl-CoA:carnitine CoA-transferase CaiB-like acyl-CoA transferase